MSEKMTTSEPTTGEIVEEARRVMLDAWGCAGCDLRTVLRQSIGRLESQEEEKNISRYLIEMQSNVITELTARAEQAERERDAAVEHVHDAIFGTNHSCFYCTMENCDGCTNSTVKEHFKYRALQPKKYLVKGEEGGKENG